MCVFHGFRIVFIDKHELEWYEMINRGHCYKKLKTLDEILEIKFPMIQGGMGRISDGTFAAECSNAGILGTIASGGMTVDKVKKEILVCRERTLHPFAVNIIMDHPDLTDLLDLVISMKISIVTVSNGNALNLIKRLKEENITVLPVIGTPEFAKFYQRAGADALIAEGAESGGHIGPMTTMTLIPQICDEVEIPVVAAGGIGDHRQFRAAAALGACGVQVGTALLVSRECPVHEDYKKALLKAKGSSSIITGRILGDEVRVLKNAMTARYFELEKTDSIDEITNMLAGSYYRAVVEGDVENGSIMAGQVCGQLRNIRTLKEIIEDICYGKTDETRR